jgi:hypothetical protein
VNPAASSDKQWGSRAAHVTAKAILTAHESEVERAVGLSGVRGVACVQGRLRNRRGPSPQPSSRQGDPYKPRVKSGLRGAGVRGDRGTVDGRVTERGSREGSLR